MPFFYCKSIFSNNFYLSNYYLQQSVINFISIAFYSLSNLVNNVIKNGISLSKFKIKVTKENTKVRTMIANSKNQQTLEVAISKTFCNICMLPRNPWRKL